MRPGRRSRSVSARAATRSRRGRAKGRRIERARCSVKTMTRNGRRREFDPAAAGVPVQPFLSAAGASVVLEAAKDFDAARVVREGVRPSGRTSRDDRDAWHRSAIVWLAAALFAAVIAGCIVTIVVALGQ